jgi:tetrahydromethanopterin S-methyltransferase subunit F
LTASQSSPNKSLDLYLSSLFLSWQGEGRIEPAAPASSEEPGEEKLYAVVLPRAAYVIVASPDYPAALAIGAVDELCEADRSDDDDGGGGGGGGKASSSSDWRQGWRRPARCPRRLQHCVSLLNRYSLREPGCLLYEYEADPEPFRDYEDDIRAYLQARDRQEREVRAAAMRDGVETARQRAEDNLRELTRNCEDCQRLLEKSEDLREQAKVFYRRARLARARMSTRRIVRIGGMVIGGFSLVLMGGLDQPILFAADTLLENIAGQGVEAALGAALGYLLANGAVESCFWAQTRVFRLA